MYWAAKKEETNDSPPWMWWRRTRTFNIEATCYAILAYIADPNTKTEEALAAIRYLNSKTNPRGGFISTQVRDIIMMR